MDINDIVTDGTQHSYIGRWGDQRGFLVHDVQDFDPDTNSVIRGDPLKVMQGLSGRYAKGFKCIYLNLPPSIGTGRISDLDTWSEALETILGPCWELLSDDGSLIIPATRDKMNEIVPVLDMVFRGRDISVSEVVYPYGPKGGSDFPWIASSVALVTPKETDISLPFMDYNVPCHDFMKAGDASERSCSNRCFYPILTVDRRIVGFGDICDMGFHPESRREVHRGVNYIYPIDRDGVERRWRFARRNADRLMNLLDVHYAMNGFADVTLREVDDSLRDFSMPDDSDDDGDRFTHDIMTPVDYVRRAIDFDPSAMVLDLFSLNGSVGHAVMESNMNHHGNRKFISVSSDESLPDDILRHDLRLMDLFRYHGSITLYETR